MNDRGQGGDAPPADETGKSPDAEKDEAELDALLSSSAAGVNRAGGLAFLAFAVLIAAALHYHFADSGGDAFLARLDADMLANAELSVKSTERGTSLAVVPSWPYRLYDSLRKDIVWYAGAAALAAYVWSLSARAAARRGATLVHARLSAEIDRLRRRVDALEKAGQARNDAGRPEEKG